MLWRQRDFFASITRTFIVNSLALASICTRREDIVHAGQGQSLKNSFAIARLLVRSSFVVGIAAACCSQNARAQAFYLHNGDRVTFYGDSITAQRLYTRDVQGFVATRYPGLQVTFHNAGVPGDKVTGGYDGDAAERVARDVKPWDPTVLTVMLGMNDGGYIPPDAKIFADYQAGYAKLITMLRAAAPQARFTLLENTTYDEITHGTEFAGYMATTEQNARALPSFAERAGMPYVDTCTPVKQLLEKASAVNPSFASLLVPDRIHPSEPLHWIMAEAVMKAWHLNPVVTSVALSASSGKPLESDRTTVSALVASAQGLSWEQLDEALPLPLDFENSLLNFVVKISDLASVDQEMLRVQGLAGAQYKLAIDKRVIGTFTAEQLTSGVNLALYKTPMWEQAREIDGALHRRSELEDSDFILEAETKVADRPAASRVLRAAEAEFEQKARAATAMKVHHYELTAVER